MTIAENLMLDRSFGGPFARRGSLQLRKLDAFANDKLIEYDVRAPGISTPVGKLSGGNQQKVVVARSCPATSGSWWPPSRRAASTWAPSSSSTSRSSLPATRGYQSSWSPPSSTRWSRSRTGSWSSTEVRVVGIVPADTPREVLGLMMTGERPTGAVA